MKTALFSVVASTYLLASSPLTYASCSTTFTESSQASIGSSIHCGRISPDKCACLPPTAQSSPPARHFG